MPVKCYQIEEYWSFCLQQPEINNNIYKSDNMRKREREIERGGERLEGIFIYQN
jgi:hypothetical protein